MDRLRHLEAKVEAQAITIDVITAAINDIVLYNKQNTTNINNDRVLTNPVTGTKKERLLPSEEKRTKNEKPFRTVNKQGFCNGDEVKITFDRAGSIWKPHD
jgi:hypothetical protein